MRATSSTPCSRSRSRGRRSTRSGSVPLFDDGIPGPRLAERRPPAADHRSPRLAAAGADGRLRARARLGRTPGLADRRRPLRPAAVPGLDRAARRLLLPRRPCRTPSGARRRRDRRRRRSSSAISSTSSRVTPRSKTPCRRGSCSPPPTESASRCAASGSSPRCWPTAPSAWSGSASRRPGSRLPRSGPGSPASCTTSSRTRSA